MARPAFKVTHEKRRTVKALAGYGLTHEQIASVIGLRSPKTLRKHFRRELAGGRAEADARVGQTLYQMATSGKHPAATLFYMKCRCGWREQPREERSTQPA